MTREEAIETLKELKHPTKPFIKAGDDEKAIDMAIEALKQEPKRKGKWIGINDGSIYFPYANCSVCHKTFAPTKMPICCPNCGSYNGAEIEE